MGGEDRNYPQQETTSDHQSNPRTSPVLLGEYDIAKSDESIERDLAEMERENWIKKHPGEQVPDLGWFMD